MVKCDLCGDKQAIFCVDITMFFSVDEGQNFDGVSIPIWANDIDFSEGKLESYLCLCKDCVKEGLEVVTEYLEEDLEDMIPLFIEESIIFSNYIH